MSKGLGGHFVVGATWNAGSVAELELLYHEIGCITDLLNQVTTNYTMDHTKCHLHHALNPSRRFIFNENVGKLPSFVCKKQNPYSLDEKPVPLHHLLSKQAVDRQVAERRLACLKNGEHVYQKYRQEVLVEKKKPEQHNIKKKVSSVQRAITAYTCNHQEGE